MFTNPTIEQIACGLDLAASREFGPLERMSLAKSMERVGMASYPPVVGDPHGDRASCDCVCDVCHQKYAAHPMDWRVIGYGNVPFLTVLCDGRRVKL
jgi:hypothetical protein